MFLPNPNQVPLFAQLLNVFQPLRVKVSVTLAAILVPLYEAAHGVQFQTPAFIC